MEVTAVSFSMLLGYLERVITRLVDPRSPSNATRYSLKDFVLGAFSAFFMQSESFLEHQRQMNSRCGRDNAQTLFGLEQVPTVEQIRNVLDGIVAQSLFPVNEVDLPSLKRPRLFEGLSNAGRQLICCPRWYGILQFPKDKLFEVARPEPIKMAWSLTIIKLSCQ